MCQRFSFAVPRERMKRQFNLLIREDLQQSFNIGAGQNAYVLTNQSVDLQIYRWGLIPHWAKDEQVGHNLINAQAEGIGAQLSFRLPVRQQRCLVFADSYYEWKRFGRQSQPFRVQLADGAIMAFAGVWDKWYNPNNANQLYSTFSIITVPANGDLRGLHPRMPVILRNGAEQSRWLTEASLHTALGLLQPLSEGLLNIYPISKDVDSLDNNNPDLHNLIELSAEEREQWGLF